MPVAMNACGTPSGTVGSPGEIASETRTALVTVSGVPAETPAYDAETCAAPGATPVASPPAVMAATSAGAAAQAAVAPTSSFEPSVYTATAPYWSAVPAGSVASTGDSVRAATTA